jgi:hypothetical protein
MEIFEWSKQNQRSVTLGDLLLWYRENDVPVVCFFRISQGQYSGQLRHFVFLKLLSSVHEEALLPNSSDTWRDWSDEKWPPFCVESTYSQGNRKQKTVAYSSASCERPWHKSIHRCNIAKVLTIPDSDFVWLNPLNVYWICVQKDLYLGTWSPHIL